MSSFLKESQRKIICDSLLTQIGGEKAARIVEYLNKAEEVSETFTEMDEIFE